MNYLNHDLKSSKDGADKVNEEPTDNVQTVRKTICALKTDKKKRKKEEIDKELHKRQKTNVQKLSSTENASYEIVNHSKMHTQIKDCFNKKWLCA